MKGMGAITFSIMGGRKCKSQFIQFLFSVSIKQVGPPHFHYLYAGMAYRFTDISVKPIYWHFLKYRLSVSVKVRTDKISAIGYQLLPNIG